jgi:hypothetical protein
VGSVVVSGEIRVTRPHQWLSLRLETSTWKPSRYVEGSGDERPLGMMLLAIELHPLPEAGGTATPDS